MILISISYFRCAIYYDKYGSYELLSALSLSYFMHVLMENVQKTYFINIHQNIDINIFVKIFRNHSAVP